MFFKARTESVELRTLRILNDQMVLAENFKKRYFKLQKGYEGELMFDSLTEKLKCPSYILNDLLLETGGAKFQIDSLMISQEPLYLFEVKNHEGDYFFENGRFYNMVTKKEMNNPLLQIERSESLLRQLLHNNGYRVSIEAYVVFINPEFTLYQAPLNKPILYPNQLPKFMKKLNGRSSTLTGRHKNLAEKLVSMHQIDTTFNKIPTYDYKSLRKGLTCADCHSFKVHVEDNKLICELCGHVELVDAAILKGVDEIKLLFPGIKITTILVQDWCRVVKSEKTIRRVLKRNLVSQGKTKGFYYE